MTLVRPNLNDAEPLIPRTEPLKEMISVGECPQTGKTLVRINSSSLQVIQECKRKAKLLLWDRWVSQNEAPATIFGSAIHKGLEVFYSGKPEDRILPRLEDMEIMSYGHTVPDEQSSLLLRATRAFVNRAELLKALPETNKRSIQNGVWILWNYFHSFLHDPFVAYIDDRGPVVERAFSFRLFEDELLIVEYFGTIDLVVRNLQTNEILVCDHKTSSVVGSDFYNRLKPNAQYTGYLMGAQRALGIQTDAFLVNCLQVKEKPKTARGSAPNFPRQVTTRDENDYAEFTEQVVSAVEDYLISRMNGKWPLGPVANCASYAGCQFLPVCSAPVSLRENILNVRFTKGEKLETTK